MLPHSLTSWLIAINIIIYAVCVVLSGEIESFNGEFLIDIGAVFGFLVVLQGEWWRLVSGLFLHGGAMHLALNMFSLYLVGKELERLISPWSYAMLYGASGIMGFLVSLMIHPANIIVGASGAIFGVFGALGAIIASLVIKKQFKKTYIKELSIVLGINLLIGLLIPSIDLSSHIGGFITGAIGGYLVSRFTIAGVFIFFIAVVITTIAAFIVLKGHYEALFIYSML